MIPLTLDPSRSEAVIHTGTRGLFSALAHDLALSAVPEACVRTEALAVLCFPVEGIRVLGVLREGVVRPEVLSARERAEIERRIVREVLAGCDKVRVEARVEGSRVRARVCVGSAMTDVDVLVLSDPALGVEGGERTLRTECVVSLKSLGIKPVRGPLGAFEVADGLRVKLRTVWV